MQEQPEVTNMIGVQVYFICAKSREWHEPATNLGQDGQQVLVESGSTYTRVHPCSQQLIPRDDSNTPNIPKNNDDNSSTTTNKQHQIHKTHWLKI